MHVIFELNFHAVTSRCPAYMLTVILPNESDICDCFSASFCERFCQSSWGIKLLFYCWRGTSLQSFLWADQVVLHFIFLAEQGIFLRKTVFPQFTFMCQFHYGCLHISSVIILSFQYTEVWNVCSYIRTTTILARRCKLLSKWSTQRVLTNAGRMMTL